MAGVTGRSVRHARRRIAGLAAVRSLWGSGAPPGDDARPGDGYGVALADGAGSPDALGSGDGAGVIAGIGGAEAIGPFPLGYVSGIGSP